MRKSGSVLRILIRTVRLFLTSDGRQGPKRGRGGLDLTPSKIRSPPVPPPVYAKASIPAMETLSTPDATSKDGVTPPVGRRLLPREDGTDVGMSSPVPLSAEAVGIITKLRNMKDEAEDWS